MLVGESWRPAAGTGEGGLSRVSYYNIVAEAPLSGGSVLYNTRTESLAHLDREELAWYERLRSQTGLEEIPQSFIDELVEAGFVREDPEDERSYLRYRYNAHQFNDSTLTVKLGKDDIVTDNSKHKTASGSSSQSSGSSSKSSQSATSGRGGGDDDEEDDGDSENGAASPYDVVDLRKGDSPLKWVLIGAGIPLLCGALILLGILIGKRTKNADKKAEEKPGETSPEPDEENTDEAENRQKNRG